MEVEAEELAVIFLCVGGDMLLVEGKGAIVG